MLTHWFFPCWSGDFRLEAAGDRCLLTVEDPTDEDRAVLRGLFVELVQRKVLVCPPPIKDFGETVIDLGAALSDVAPLVAGGLHPEGNVWTALRFSGGKVTLADGVPAEPPSSPLTVRERLTGNPWSYFGPCKRCGALRESPCIDLRNGTRRLKVAHPGRERDLPSGVPEAAVTLGAPSRGCPPPTACERRASEVLACFSTGRQMQDWNQRGRMRVFGGATGRSYLLFHRDEAARLGRQHTLVEVSSGREVCVFDNRVPPAEEALAIKLGVEHRESWLREHLQ